MRWLLLLCGLLSSSALAFSTQGYVGWTASEYDVFAHDSGTIYGLTLRQEWDGATFYALLGPRRSEDVDVLIGGASIPMDDHWTFGIGRPLIPLSLYPTDRLEPTTGPGVSIENSPFVASLLESITFANAGMRIEGWFDAVGVSIVLFDPAAGVERTAAAQAVAGPALSTGVPQIDALLSVELPPIANVLVGTLGQAMTSSSVDRATTGGSVALTWQPGRITAAGSASYLSDIDLRVAAGGVELSGSRWLAAIEVLWIAGPRGSVSGAAALALCRFGQRWELAGHVNATEGAVESNDYGVQLRYKRGGFRALVGWRGLSGQLQIANQLARLDDQVIEAQAVWRW